MIKKILLATLLAGTAVSPAAVSNQPATPISHEVIKLTSEETSNLIAPETNVMGKHKELAENEEEFVMNGFSYTRNYSSSFKMQHITDASIASQFGFLFMSRDLYFDGERNNISWTSNFNFSDYTNVRDVIVNNAEYSKISTAFGTFDHDINLYLVGKVDLSDFQLSQMTNVKNIVFASTIAYDSFLTNDTNHSLLRSSNIEHIYFAEWLPNHAEILNDIETCGKTFKNKNDQNISFEVMPEDSFIYDKTFFNPIEGIVEEEHYGFDGYYYAGNSNRVLSLSSLRYLVTNVNEYVDTLIYNSNVEARPEIVGDINNFVTNTPAYRFQGHVNNYYVTDVETTTIRTDIEFSMNNLFIKGKTGLEETPVLHLNQDASTYTNLLPRMIVSDMEVVKDNELIPDQYIESIKGSFALPERNVLKFNNKLLEVEDSTTDVKEHVRMLREMDAKSFVINVNKTIEANYQAFKNQYPGDTSVPEETPVTPTPTPTPSTPATPSGTTPTTNPSNPHVDYDVYVEPASEQQEGLHLAGSLIFSNNYTIQEAVNIALSKMLWDNRELKSSNGFDYKVKAYPNNEYVSISLYKDGELVNSMGSYYKTVESNKKFVYCSSGYYGSLLINADETAYNPLNLYKSVIGTYTTIYSGGDFSNLKLNENNQILVNSILKRNNGKYYEGILNCYVMDLSNISNNNLEYSEIEVVSSVNDPRITENYRVLDIDTLYFPPYLRGDELPQSAIDLVITDSNGNRPAKSVGANVLSEEGHFYLNINFDNVILKKEINMVSIPNSYKMGYMKLANNDIVAVLPYRESGPFNNRSMTNELNTFIKNILNISETGLDVPSELTAFTATKDYTGSTYANGDITIYTSGIAVLLNSSRDNPIKLETMLYGKQVFSDIYYSDNYTLDEVMEVILDKLYYVDGKKVKNVKINYSIHSNDNVSISVYLNDEYQKGVFFTTIKVPSKVGPFVYVGAYNACKGTLLIEKDKNNKTLPDVFNYILQHITHTDINTIETVMPFNKVGTKNISGVVQHSNFNYYEYDIDVKVCDFKEEKKLASSYSYKLSNEDETGENTDAADAEKKESFGDKVKGFFENFKTKFEENTAFKAGMIAVGSILGLAILFGIYLLIRKLYRWLRR